MRVLGAQEHLAGSAWGPVVEGTMAAGAHAAAALWCVESKGQVSSAVIPSHRTNPVSTACSHLLEDGTSRTSSPRPRPLGVPPLTTTAGGPWRTDPRASRKQNKTGLLEGSAPDAGRGAGEVAGLSRSLSIQAAEETSRACPPCRPRGSVLHDL